MESVQSAVDLHASLGSNGPALNPTLSRTATQLKRSSSVRKKPSSLERNPQNAQSVEHGNERFVLRSPPEIEHREYPGTPLRSMPALGADSVTSDHLASSTYEEVLSVRKIGMRNHNQVETSTIVVGQHTPRSTSPLTAVQRSSSAPVPAHVLPGYDDKSSSQPMRGVSLSSVPTMQEDEAAELGHGIPALNGVSIFYSSKVNEVSMPVDQEIPSQCTNSRKIRRCFSLQERERITRCANLVRTYTTRSLRPLLKNVPFSQLMRSTSLDNVDFLQSLKQLQAIRDAMHDTARSKHWFRAGQISASSRSTVMRAAFPALKCSSCPRLFRGADRKRRYVRHCKRLHGSSSLDADAEEEELETEEMPVSLPARSKGVRTVDEFLLDLPINATYEITLSALPQKFDALYDEYTARSISKAITYSHDVAADLRQADSSSIDSFDPPSARTLSRPLAMPTSFLCMKIASDAGNTLWNKDYVPWAQDRIHDAALAPIVEAEELERAVPPTFQCPHCAVTYTGSHGEQFLARHVLTRHRPGDLDTANQAISSIPECRFCGAKFHGIGGKQLSRRHEISCLCKPSLDPVARSRELPIGGPILRSTPITNSNVTYPMSYRVLNLEDEIQPATTYPPEVCNLCGTTFAGRYGKGNLARHTRERHYEDPTKANLGCAYCPQTFLRAEARRKHEWTEHQLLDTEPSKIVCDI